MLSLRIEMWKIEKYAPLNSKCTWELRISVKKRHLLERHDAKWRNKPQNTLMSKSFIVILESLTDVSDSVLINFTESWASKEFWGFIWCQCCSWFELCKLLSQRPRRQTPCSWPRPDYQCANQAAPAPTLSSWGSGLYQAHLDKTAEGQASKLM